ncbi:phospholipid carrier-dependent glycosyltransferase [Dactylosporangium sp. CA-233914]|uniref:phospholipid carrier-dependent glycosyltransferase n=1 Tax=Dactylosporangium sp. CA-233914 TaxID=3239934 RepID=UPI003D9495CF
MPREATRRRIRVTEGRLVFAASLLCYLAIAWWFWHSRLIPGDSTSRVANAYYILFSRDPHLAAVGFVWNPLPSLVLLPVLPMKSLLPALTRDGLLAALSSALFMAGTVAAGNDILRRLRVSRLPRIVLTVLFASHPMMLVYSGNGMSEACFMFFLVLSVRALLRWFDDGRAERLVPLGLSLGLAYGARYEALAPGLAVPAVVAAVSWWRGRGRPKWRYATAQADAVLVALPVALSVAGWALASKIIVGQWFATFSSAYGNAAQVTANERGIHSITGDALGDRIVYALQQLLGLQPLLPLLLAVAAVVALLRRDPRMLAPITVLGAVLAFGNLAFLSGNSFGWLRFQIVAVPLAILLIGILLAAPADRPAPALAGLPLLDNPARQRRPRLTVSPLAALLVGITRSAQRDGAARATTTATPARTHARRVAAAAAVLAALLAAPSTVATLQSPRLAREESEWFTDAGAARTSGLAHLNTRVARDLDAMALPEGSVITDSAYAFAVIVASRNPRQFVITSDRDFPATLTNLGASHVRYLLISANGAADAVRTAHPASGHPGAGTPGSRSWADQWGVVLWTLIPVEDFP